jgi:hypothetical protein
VADGGEAGEADEEATTPLLPQQPPRPGTAAALPNHEEAVVAVLRLHLPAAAEGTAFYYFIILLFYYFIILLFYYFLIKFISVVCRRGGREGEQPEAPVAVAPAPEPLVDIGANLTHASFRADFDAVLDRAQKANVRAIVLTGTSPRVRCVR